MAQTLLTEAQSCREHPPFEASSGGFAEGHGWSPALSWWGRPGVAAGLVFSCFYTCPWWTQGWLGTEEGDRRKKKSSSHTDWQSKLCRYEYLSPPWDEVIWHRTWAAWQMSVLSTCFSRLDSNVAETMFVSKKLYSFNPSWLFQSDSEGFLIWFYSWILALTSGRSGVVIGNLVSSDLIVNVNVNECETM